VGNEVEIRESTSLVQRPKWHRATVLAVGDENEIPRDLEGGAVLELLGVNAAGKNVPLTLLNRKGQVCVCSLVSCRYSELVLRRSHFLTIISTICLRF
jgi:hypothetical protein